MKTNNKCIGSKKHGRSGWKNGAGKSPKLRLHEKMEAEKNEIKRKKLCHHSDIKELFFSISNP